MDEGILIRQLNFSYGHRRVLSDFNLEISRGMFGLLGQNGAGKTTLMKILSGLLVPQKGGFTLCGTPNTHLKELRKKIGYLPQTFDFYPHISVVEALYYLGALSGLKGADLKKRTEEVLMLCNLWDCKKKKIKTLSGGMKQRVGIAQAILHNPQVLIVDEPTSGLDPEERIRFRNLLAGLSKEKVVLISTHIPGDIESTCGEMAILNQGRILFRGDIQTLLAKAKDITYMVQVPFSEFSLFEKEHIVFSRNEKKDFIEAKIIYQGRPKPYFIPAEPSLEAAYLNVIYDEGGRRS